MISFFFLLYLFLLCFLFFSLSIFYLKLISYLLSLYYFLTCFFLHLLFFTAAIMNLEVLYLFLLLIYSPAVEINIDRFIIYKQQVKNNGHIQYMYKGKYICNLYLFTAIKYSYHILQYHYLTFILHFWYLFFFLFTFLFLRSSTYPSYLVRCRTNDCLSFVAQHCCLLLLIILLLIIICCLCLISLDMTLKWTNYKQLFFLFVIPY